MGVQVTTPALEVIDVDGGTASYSGSGALEEGEESEWCTGFAYNRNGFGKRLSTRQDDFVESDTDIVVTLKEKEKGRENTLVEKESSEVEEKSIGIGHGEATNTPPPLLPILSSRTDSITNIRIDNERNNNNNNNMNSHFSTIIPDLLPPYRSLLQPPSSPSIEETTPSIQSHQQSYNSTSSTDSIQISLWLETASQYEQVGDYIPALRYYKKCRSLLLEKKE